MIALYVFAGWIGLSCSYICVVEWIDSRKHRRMVEETRMAISLHEAAREVIDTRWMREREAGRIVER